jgi:hypothetical protein
VRASGLRRSTVFAGDRSGAGVVPAAPRPPNRPWSSRSRRSRGATIRDTTRILKEVTQYTQSGLCRLTGTSCERFERCAGGSSGVSERCRPSAGRPCTPGGSPGRGLPEAARQACRVRSLGGGSPRQRRSNGHGLPVSGAWDGRYLDGLPYSRKSVCMNGNTPGRRRKTGNRTSRLMETGGTYITTADLTRADVGPSR